MTAVSLINPYAPQPATGVSGDTSLAAVQSALPVAGSSGSRSASDHAGHGAGNGTGTGGAHLNALLKRGRDGMAVQQATPRSVVEALSKSDPATEFLARQAQRQAEARAVEEARVARQAAARTAEAKAEAARAAQPEFDMPNPLPTAPILQRD